MSVKDITYLTHGPLLIMCATIYNVICISAKLKLLKHVKNQGPTQNA